MIRSITHGAHPLLATVLAICFLASQGAQASDPALPFTTAPATLQSVSLERLFDGTVEAVHQATVSAQTAGRIAEIFYDVDDYVEAGATLIRFTNVEQQTALRQAEAQLAEARARSVEATEEYRRAQNLLERGLGSQRDLDRALAGRESATARVASSESGVIAARQQLDYTLVKAPYAGIVTQRHIETGESVTIGQALISGLSLEQLRVRVDLPQQVATRIRPDPRAEILADEGRIAPQDVTIFPVADTKTNTFRVRLDLPPGQFGLYPGMFVKVAFKVGEAERLLVPAPALVHRSEVTAVYVVDKTTVRLRQVRIGQAYDGQVEVLAGLKAGDMVALDPVRAGIYAKTPSASTQ